MNEPAQRCEEQIISPFQDRDTFVCSGWMLADLPGKEKLLEQYRRAGFCRACLYRRYQKGDTENGFTE